MRSRLLAAALAALLVASSVLAPAVVAAAQEDSGGTVTGEIDVQMDSATNGSTASYELANATQASDFNVTLEGVRSTEQEAVSATGLGSGDTLDAQTAGTAPPESETVTFTGMTRTRGAFWSGSGVSSGDSTTIDVLGNLDPTNQEVTFTGKESTAAASWSRTSQSDGSTATIDVGGNTVPENQSVTFTGIRTETVADVSESGVSLTRTRSLSIGGNQEPVADDGGDPLLSVTAYAPQSTYNPVDNEADGTTGSSHAFIGDSGTDGVNKGEVKIVPQSSGTVEQITPTFASAMGSDYGVTVDIYIVQESEPDGTYGEGTLVKSDWDPDWSSGAQTVSLDTPVDVTTGTSYSVEFVSSGTDSDGTGDYLRLASNSDASSTWLSYGDTSSTGFNYGDLDVSIQSSVSDLDVGDGAGHTHSFGSFSDGETKTVRLNLTQSSTELDFTSTDSGTIDYSLERNDVTVTEDPSVDVNGDGSADASYSGMLAGGETKTVALSNLDNGSVDVVSSLKYGPVDWSISADEVTATENPRVDVGGDGSIEAEYTGVLRGGETATVSLSSLTTGSNTLAFGTNAATVDWRVDATERARTEDPSVDIDGDGNADASYSGMLADGDKVTRDVDLDLGSNTAGVSTASFSEVDVQVDWTEVTKSKNPSVSINGNEVAYDGTLADGETASLNASLGWLQDGTNTVTVEVGEDLPASAPRARVDLQYQHTATTTHSTTYNATAWMEERTINKTFVDDRQDAELRLYMQPSVMTIQQLKMGKNGADLERVDPSKYNYSDGVVTLQLGDVQANTSVEVYAKGRRIRVHDGEISVLDPTLPGKELDTKFSITNKGSDFAIEFPTQRVVHTTDESWGNPGEYARVTADGTQMFHAPGASEGSTARAEYTPLKVMPEAGDVEVSIEDLGNRQFSVDPGQTTGDTIEYRWVNVVEGADYALYSITHRNTYGTAAAKERGVTITDDDSPETLQFVSQNEDGPGPIGTGETLRSGLVLLFAGGALVGTYLIQTRYGSGVTGVRDYVVLVLVATVVGGLGMEVMSPGSVSKMVSTGAFPMLLASIFGVGVLYWSSNLLPGGRRAKLAYFAAGFVVVGLTLLETLSPGSVSNTLGPTFSQAIEPAIRIGGLGLVGLALYQAYRWQTGSDSSGGSGGSGESNSSGGDASAVNVIVSDDDDTEVSQ